MLSGPSEPTRATSSAVGASPSARAAATSSESRNGLPPVARSLEQLRGDPEGERLLELAAARLEHLQRPVAREPRRVPQELRLADTRLTLEQQHAARPLDHPGDHGQLWVALDQPGGV